MQTFFSVIIPVYNSKAFLEECVRSLLGTAVPIEIILIDDGSEDGSSELCDWFSGVDGRITVTHQENGGLSAARNAGLAIASGEYVVFLDSDDWLAPGALDALEQCLSANNRADVLITRVTESFPDGTVSNRDPHMEWFVSGLTGAVTKNDAIKWVFHDSDCASIAPRFIAKTELLRHNQLRFEEGRLHEDVAWTVELMARANTFCFYTECWYYYRKAVSGSISANVQLKNIEDVIYFTRKYFPLEEFSGLNEAQKGWIRESLSNGCCYALSKLTGLSPQCRRHAAQMLGSAQVLSCARKPKHRLFVCLMRLIGCQNAIMCLTTVLDWKTRVSSIASNKKSGKKR